ncbi:peptide chain release factor N(5)-glutamine methyltransferase [Mycoplasmoides pirum]|uniref:peptide chain release factor N(5)-glutamine methyltransferase n=1 Tax=Mycoplasmoides pirum TaxID=2122 RepID=UPI0006971EC5|nr:peptide chain release factor N(5)-glutamine methyltransferase [Mycoplasmoides pirum]
MTFLELQNKFKDFNNEPVFYELIFFISNKIKNKTDLILFRDNKIDFNLNKFKYLMNQYFVKKVPLGYITNETIFFQNKFFVNENVLIPREDTETVLKKFVLYVKKTNYQNKNILDLCTGSGCIALSLSKIFPNNKIYGSDISSKALLVAKQNKKIFKAKNVFFIKANFLDCLKKINKSIDYLICNPPYIDKNDLDINSSVNLYEPKKALYSSKKGLKFYIDFLNFAINNKWYPKICCFEFGFKQKEQIKDIFKPISKIYKIHYFNDDNNLPRCTILIRK